MKTKMSYTLSDTMDGVNRALYNIIVDLILLYWRVGS